MAEPTTTPISNGLELVAPVVSPDPLEASLPSVEPCVPSVGPLPADPLVAPLELWVEPLASPVGPLEGFPEPVCRCLRAV
jgi:hypothetical protein